MESFIEDFDYWRAEYWQNPLYSDAEQIRLFTAMCAQGNPHAIEFQRTQDLKNDSTARVEPSLVAEDEEYVGPYGSAALTVANVPTEYVADWPQIATATKSRRGWRCEVCKFTAYGSGVIHVHHVNHEKSDNSSANLQVLCAICHGLKHGGFPVWGHSSEQDRKALMTHHGRRRSVRSFL